MTHDTRPFRRRRGFRLRRHLLTLACVGMVGMAALGRLAAPVSPDPADPEPAKPAPIERPAATAKFVSPVQSYAWMLDRTPTLGSRALGIAHGAPLPASFAPTTVPVTKVAVAAPAEKPRPVILATKIVQTVPLPMPRPAGLLAAEPPRLAQRPIPQRTRVATANAEADRSFFDMVFGAKPQAEPALAYAAPEKLPLDSAPRRSLSPVPFPGTAGTAIYNITAQSVTLPSGERLEAHSGLGHAQDNPQHVHLRMRGATPPGTYELTEREALFHGVRAIRLSPVGGPGAVYGRVGLLAHTFMLGPSGASNGCVVFRNYKRFLQAYLNGEVRRLVVVSGSGQDAFPALADRLLGRTRREASAE